MPIFKPKNTKKIILSKKNITTLDSKHKEITDLINKDKDETLPSLLKQKDELKQKMKMLCLSIDEQLELRDKLHEIKEKIKEINKKEKDYLLNNSSYIFEYFENKKKIADCANKTTLLDNFFKIKNDDNISKDELNKEKQNIQTYLANVDENFLDINNFVVATDICKFCNKGEMIAVDYEGIMVCNVCSNT